MSDAPSANSHSRRWLAIVLVVAAALLVAWFLQFSRPSTDELLAEAQAAFDEGRFAVAAEMAGQVLARDPQHTAALLLAGETAAKREEFQAAVDFFGRISDAGGDDALTANRKMGSILFHQLHRLSDAERALRAALEHAPEDPLANEELAALLVISGRSRDAVPYLVQLARLERIGPHQLSQLNSDDRMAEDEVVVPFLKQCRSAAPDDPLPLLGLAHQAVKDEQWTEATALLRQALDIDPELPTAHVLLGRALLDSGAIDQLSDWEQALPQAGGESPDVWSLRGAWALQSDLPQRAIRCFWEALRRDPDQPQALRAFPELLVAEGFAEQARPVQQRANLQDRLDTLLTAVAEGNVDPNLLKQVVDALQAQGRILEAHGWLGLVLQQNPQLPWAQQRQQQLQRRVAAAKTKTLSRYNPVRRLDFSGDPSEWAAVNRSGSRSAAGNPQSDLPTTIAFANVADSVNLHFKYFNGAPRDAQTHRMYEFTGGGVAVIDYDADGWPDLYLSQGAHGPPDPRQDAQYQDRLFRNVAGRRFEDVTVPAGLGDTSYSQGVTVGDFDNDGLPDLYLANIGRNRLYRNRGDGAFEDVSDQLTPPGESWTTSCLLADLNGDALPDLYDVNYLQGRDVFTRTCRTPEGKTSSCLPVSFDAAPDRLFLNQGDGGFEDVTTAAGITAPKGNGLGIVALDMHGDGLLSLFIANDQVPNHLYANQTADRTAPPAFVENAMLAGVAVDQAGREQACMGVACGDADGNGQLDLFVTNFANEHNTLYFQHSGQLFLDSTQSAGLVAPSMEFLGFGTQFFDADLDGWLDAIVTNGHIDDSGGVGTMFEMRPQFFLNRTRGKFVELHADQVGEFFSQPRLGRGLALLDWNRDGLPDAAISHLDDDPALLENRTSEPGAFLSLSLRGAASSRDAIGAQLTVALGDRTLVAQLTAGDGYMASNQRQILFGLGDHTAAEQLTIRWPSGTEQVFENVAANQHYIAVEGRDELLRLPVTSPPPG